MIHIWSWLMLDSAKFVTHVKHHWTKLDYCLCNTTEDNFDRLHRVLNSCMSCVASATDPRWLLFNAYWYESVKPLPVSITQRIPMRKLLFWKKMLSSENVVLCLLVKSWKDSFIALADKFHIRSDDLLNASAFTVRDRFWFYFSNLIA